MFKTLQDLTLRDRHAIAVAVTLACVRRLEELIQRSDPQDAPLQSLLDSQGSKALVQAEQLERYQSRFQPTGVSRLTRKEMDALIQRHFPSLSWPLGEGIIDRREGTYLVECLDDECSAFYLVLAEGADDSGSRVFFQGLGKQEVSFLEFVRHVLLF